MVMLAVVIKMVLPDKFKRLAVKARITQARGLVHGAQYKG